MILHFIMVIENQFTLNFFLSFFIEINYTDTFEFHLSHNFAMTSVRNSEVKIMKLMPFFHV